MSKNVITKKDFIELENSAISAITTATKSLGWCLREVQRFNKGLSQTVAAKDAQKYGVISSKDEKASIRKFFTTCKNMGCDVDELTIYNILDAWKFHDIETGKCIIPTKIYKITDRDSCEFVLEAEYNAKGLLKGYKKVTEFSVFDNKTEWTIREVMGCIRRIIFDEADQKYMREVPFLENADKKKSSDAYVASENEEHIIRATDAEREREAMIREANAIED